MESTELVFLKLGGSLITDKATPHTANHAAIADLAAQTRAALDDHPSLQLLLGHGSGSFGHVPARRFGTRRGVSTPEEWRGFAEVWLQATDLNRILVSALHAAGLPAVTFSPSGAALAADGRIERWDLDPLTRALAAGLLPVVHGDVAFDTARGGTVLSTEDVFSHLALQLLPRRVLIAGSEEGVWADYPACTQLVARITPQSIPAGLQGSPHTDVTGGMAGKVAEMLALARALPGLEIRIFSAVQPGSLRAALLGEPVGTLILGQ